MASSFPNAVTMFKPGVSGNPGGVTRLHKQFRMALEHAMVSDDPNARAQELADLTWAAARDREPWAIQLLFQRLMPQTLNVSLESGDASEIQKIFLSAIAVLPAEQRNAVAKQMLAIEAATDVEVKPNGTGHGHRKESG